MGKWLQHLADTQSDKNLDSRNTAPTKPTKVLLYPFVGARPEISTKNDHQGPTYQEQAESSIDSLNLHDDRVFVRRCLVGVYGEDRLAIIQQYLSEWKIGAASVAMEVKKENAGRHRANVWLRERLLEKGG